MFTKMKFYAHSGQTHDELNWQDLSNHLTNVADIAAMNARYFGAGELAQVAGLLHDLGKYSQAFQQRLRGSNIRADHSTAGAKIAVERWGKLGKILAFVVAGHHAGLANGVDEGKSRSTLEVRLQLPFATSAGIPGLDNIWQSEIVLPEVLSMPKLKPVKEFRGFQTAFLIRMLYSCLVDADFIDTDNFYRRLENRASRQINHPSLSALKVQFDAHLQALQNHAQKNHPSQLNTLRKEILSHARTIAAQPSGLFSLTVPTGGGKTFASMAFALDHALAHNKRRVIYVIPFTSIIEQNAKVFRDAFGALGKDAVLEHHSAFEVNKIEGKDSKDKLKLAMENWDAPIVVTTAVQFFESLFADRSSQCRKLHNIAGSVIILDEAQTLPLKLLRPVMEAIKELVRNYQCTVVLCTATQPALMQEHGFYNGFEAVQEIAPDPARLFRELKRVTVQSLGEQSDEQLKAHLANHEQILMIVNNRRHARSLYEGMKHLPGARHLTTLMCAKHRSKVLDAVRADLKAGKPCRLVSTSLIEAGVDVDFPVVFRAETGLDSIAQAAGRCNREGRRAVVDSCVSIFQTRQDEWKAPPELAQLAGNMRAVVRNHAGDLLAPDAIKLYFQNVYWAKGNELDAKKIMDSHSAHAPELSFPFQNIAQDFRMIESHLIPVIVPYDKKADELIDALWNAEHIGAIARQLQPYLVQIPQNGLEALRKEGRVELIAPQKLGEQFWCLIEKDLYHQDAGLSWDDPMFVVNEQLVV